jgi:Fe2+ transport system protein A
MIMAKGMSGALSQPLAAAPERTSYYIDRVSGPERRRLCELGLVEGAEISVVNRSRHGMMVVKIGGSRLALARGMADYVWVK